MDRIKRPRPTTWIAGLLALAILVTTAEAFYLWYLNPERDEAGSLAFVTVAATLALALAAVLTLRQNDSLIKAAVDEASAAVEQAKASAEQAKASNATVKEMETQRELANRPYLVYAGRGTVTPVDTGRFRVYPSQYHIIKNIGTGPAVNVVMCMAAQFVNSDGVRWLSASIAGIAAGDEWHVYEGGVGVDARAQRYRCVVDDLAMTLNPDQEVFAFRYQDWFGKYYRAPGSHDDQKPAEWAGAPTELEAPNWMRCS